MSVVLNGSSQYLQHGAAVVSSPAFTICGWVKPDVSTGSRPLLSIEAHNYNSKYTLLGNNSSKVQIFVYYGSSGESAYTTTTFGTGSWIHWAAVLASTSDRRVFLDGGGKGTNTDAKTVSGVTRTVIGAYNEYFGWSGFFDGKIAHVTIWDTALTDAEILELAGGKSGLTMQTGNLVAHWELTSNGDDSVGSYDMTAYGSPTWDGADVPSISGGVISRSASITGAGLLGVTKKITVKKSGIAVVGAGGLQVEKTSSNSGKIATLHPAPSTLIVPGWASDIGKAAQWSTPKLALPPSTVQGGATRETQEDTGGTNIHTGAAIYQGHERPWCELVHLLPRVLQNVGNLVTEQTIQCELYNADRTSEVTISSVTNNLGDGFEVVGVPATPFVVKSQEGLSFQIKVLQTGDLAFDSTYTFNQSTGETYTIRIIGSRIVMLPIRPEAPLREHLVFDTAITEAIDGTELRVANRQYPRGRFEYVVKGERRRLELLLFDRQSKIIAVPAWHEPATVSSAVASGATVVNVDTTANANFYVGGYAVILSDEHTFDALKIQSVTSTSLTFESATANAYAVGTQVMPLMTAFVAPATPATKEPYNDQTFRLEISTLAEPNDIASSTGWSTYDGKVFLDDPNFLSNAKLQDVLKTKVYVLDNITGDMEQFRLWDGAQRHSAKGWKTNSRAELWKLRQLLHFLKGRQVSFYIPTFSKDLEPNTTLVNASTAFNMDHIGYVVNADKRWPKQVIRVVLKNGTILVRTILGATEVSKSVEQLTVDTAWPYDIAPSDIERVEFLEKVRLDSDDIVITHYNALGWAECVVPIREVKK